MSNPEEIEVEVVEVGESRPVSRPDKTAEPQKGQAQRAQRPFGGIPRRPLRIPAYLWPLAVVLGLLFLVVALVVLIVIVIPFLIIRAILRLLFGGLK